MRPRRDCGTSGASRIPAPRPGAGRVRRSLGPRPAPALGRAFFSECVFPFPVEAGAPAAAWGFLQPYNRMGETVVGAEGTAGCGRRRSGSSPFPRESRDPSDREASVLFRSHRLLISCLDHSTKASLPGYWDLGSRKVIQPFTPGASSWLSAIPDSGIG